MSIKRKISIGCIFALLVSVCVATPFTMARAEVAPSQNSGYVYFEEQLDEDAQKFYDVLKTMLIEGYFQSGSSYDLVEHGVVTQEQLKDYVNGKKDLMKAYGAARDAFCADNPSIFYVDFSNLSIRVTLKDGLYGAKLGNGRTDSYLNGFVNESEVVSAQSQFSSALSTVVELANKEDNDRAKATVVHDFLINNVEYTLESDASPSDKDYVHSAFGALVLGKAVCEGYARAYKSILDILNIPCILVQGLYSASDSQREAHMWNYVQLNGVWYAVDVTMDDRIDDVPNREYLFRSSGYMNNTHIPDGVMSPASFEFYYPGLSNDKLRVYYGYETKNSITYQSVFFGYEGLTFAQMKNAGYMIVVGSYTEEQGEEVVYWASLESFILNGNYTQNDQIFQISNTSKIQIALVEYNSEDFNSFYKYLGSEEDFIESSDVIVADPDIIRYPYLKKATPTELSTLEVGKTHSITLVFGEDLKLDASNPDINVQIISADTESAILNAKISGVDWDKNIPDRLTFRFSPSQMYGDDLCNYTLQVVGLVGKDSNHSPLPIEYRAMNRAVFNCPMSDGVNYRVYGKPVLLENSDLSTENWKYSDGTSVGDDISYRLSLVASKTSETENNEMTSAIKNSGVTPISCSTYNINLTLCLKQIEELPDGQAIKVLMPFPEGYGPESEGVQFKAYHFNTNERGEIISTDEVDCFITMYGLVLKCSSFSPYAIVAVQSDTAVVNTNVFVYAGKGGTTSAENITIEQGQTKNFTISAKSGYKIDYLLVNGKPIEVDNKDVVSVEIVGNKLLVYGNTTQIIENYIERNNVIEAFFVSETVYNAEIQKGEKVAPTAVSISPIEDVEENKGGPKTIFIIVGCCAFVLSAVLIGVGIFLRKKAKRRARELYLKNRGN